MGRLKTLFTGQWADLPLKDLAAKAARWGYDGLELACWGDHFDVSAALGESDYCGKLKKLLESEGLACAAISTHLVGQLTLSPGDERTDAWVPADCRGDASKKSAWAAEEIKRTAKAAKAFGVSVVNGFVGSPIWDLWYPFPPLTEGQIAGGYERFAQVWNPILDAFRDNNVRFALEVHPTEIAFDIHSAKRALDALGDRPEFGFNFDPSHLYWQGISPHEFIYEFPDRIFHVHIKDAALSLDGRNGILASHLPFGHPKRGWDFRSPGRGEIDFEAIVRALNDVGYKGPLSVEWEDCGMEREYGAADAVDFLKRVDFQPSGQSFEKGFA